MNSTSPTTNPLARGYRTWTSLYPGYIFVQVLWYFFKLTVKTIDYLAFIIPLLLILLYSVVMYQFYLVDYYTVFCFCFSWMTRKMKWNNKFLMQTFSSLLILYLSIEAKEFDQKMWSLVEANCSNVIAPFPSTQETTLHTL